MSALDHAARLPAAVTTDLASGQRWVAWTLVNDQKVPRDPGTGNNASVTNPRSWGTFDAARTRAERDKLDGIGIVFDGDGLGGVDLDGCRDPETGVVATWAMAVVRDFNSYTEVSPSGTGLKIYARGAPSALPASKIPMDGLPIGGKAPAIEAYVTGRWFAVTGLHLACTPDEVVDATEAWERLTHRLRQTNAGKKAKGNGAHITMPTAPAAELDARLKVYLAIDPELARLWHGDKATGDTSASGKDASLVARLHRAGADHELITYAFSAYQHGQLAAGKLKGNKVTRRLADLIANFATPDAVDGAERERIEITPQYMNRAVRRSAELLRDRVYLFGPKPMALVPTQEAGGEAAEDSNPEPEPGIMLSGVRHAEGSLIFQEPNPSALQYHLEELVDFVRFARREQEWHPTSCPMPLIGRLLGAASELGLRQCTGIVGVPLFRNGEIVAEPGYHHPTGKIIAFNGTLPPIPAAPTKDEAKDALAVLLQPFRGYLSGDDPKLEAGITAAVLTAVARASLDTAPAMLLDANAPGAGKGKLARALAVLATGALPAIITEGHNDEETEKRLASAILSGSQALLLDNLQRTLASSTLESILTEGVATIRPFGKLGADITMPFAGLVIITANNAAMRTDLLRRMLPIRIVVDTDTPEEREFDFDPYEEAKCDRMQILAAGFTILRAYRNSGQKGTHKLGSFEHWADLVAGAVEWLTGTNPIALIKERKAEDPVRAEEMQVIAGLSDLFRESEWTAKEAVGRPAPANQTEDNPIPETGLATDLWRAVIDFKTERPSPREVGKWLGRQKDKVFGDMRLACRVNKDHTTVWTVVGKAKATPNGDHGDQRGSNTPAVRELAEHDKQEPQHVTPNHVALGSVIPVDPRDPRQTAWDDAPAWDALYREAGKNRDERLRVIGAWATAAGGQLTTVGDALHLRLPVVLRSCPALNTMKPRAEGMGLRVVLVDGLGALPTAASAGKALGKGLF